MVGRTSASGSEADIQDELGELLKGAPPPISCDILSVMGSPFRLRCFPRVVSGAFDLSFRPILPVSTPSGNSLCAERDRCSTLGNTSRLVQSLAD